MAVDVAGIQAKLAETPAETYLTLPVGVVNELLDTYVEAKQNLPVTPAAAATAEAAGLDLTEVEGTGKDGKITKTDVVAAAQDQGLEVPAQAPGTSAPTDAVPVTETPPVEETPAEETSEETPAEETSETVEETETPAEEATEESSEAETPPAQV